MIKPSFKQKSKELIKKKHQKSLLSKIKIQGMAAELLGVTIKVFVICMVVTSANNNNLRILDVAIAHFLIITALAHSIGRVSGCQLNPAVTLSLMVFRKLDLINGVLYMIMQLIGGIIGALFAFVLSSKDWLDLESEISQMGNNTIAPNFTVFQGFFGEFLMTSILVFTVWAVCIHESPERCWAPVSIGAVVMTSVLILGPITGNSLNPVRSFGPAVVTGKFFNDHWVFWVAPLLGGLFGASIYNLLYLKKREKTQTFNKPITSDTQKNDTVLEMSNIEDVSSIKPTTYEEMKKPTTVKNVKFEID